MPANRLAQPLSQHLVVRTNDATEFEARLSATYNDTKIQIASGARGQASSHELYVAPFGRMMLTSMTFYSPMVANAPELEQMYDFCRPQRGSAEVFIGGESCDFSPTCGVVLSPHRPFRVRSEGYCTLDFSVPRAVMTAHLQGLVGRELEEPVEFQPTIDFRNKKLESFWRMVDFLATEIEYPDSTMMNPLVCERYGETLLTGFLLNQPHNYSQLLYGKIRAAEPQYVRRIEEYLEAHCDQAITTSQLATIADVSARALHAGFKQHRGYTPLEFLRRIRLRRVRDDLLSAPAS